MQGSGGKVWDLRLDEGLWMSKARWIMVRLRLRSKMTFVLYHCIHLKLELWASVGP